MSTLLEHGAPLEESAGESCTFQGRKRETHPGVVTDLGFACAGVWRIQVIVWAWRGQAKEIPWSSRKISAHDGNGVKMLLLRLRITEEGGYGFASSTGSRKKQCLGLSSTA